jgi:cytosolic iron-sulfur protein assembly protein CIAO1
MKQISSATMTSALPTLTSLAALHSPSGLTRAWQSKPHTRKALLATASSDKTVNIWSLRDYRLLSTITGGHKRSIRTVGWKDYGKREKPNLNYEDGNKGKLTLATGSFDANVGIWEYNVLYNKSSADAMEADVTNGTRNEDEEWHFSTLLTGPDSEIKSLDFSPAHYSVNLLATASRDKSVWIWEEVEDDEWETIAVLSEHAGDVKCVSWNPAREMLASGSYDDTIRLWRDVEEEEDWACVGVLEGSGGTVWEVVWEKYHTEEGLWEPRLASCSDDLSVRIWKRALSEREREKQNQMNGTSTASRLPSILRPASTFETWEQEAVLPTVHVRPVYAIDWSAKTGLLVSCGGDGVIAVYREIAGKEENRDLTANATEEHASKSNWEVVALLDEAHDEYEVNHVSWAPRWDKGKRKDREEVLVSTGDDGTVRVWELPEELT